MVCCKNLNSIGFMHSIFDTLGARIRLRFHVLLISIVFLVLVSMVTWEVVSRSQEALIEFEAVKLAEIIADQASAARSAYAELAVSKLRNDGLGASEASDDLEGHIPLPAQFLRELSRRSQLDPNAVFSFRPISRWNLVPEQGIVDDFQKWAWAKLESQQSNKASGPIEWSPVWRIDEINGEHMLRYLRSDPASSPSCVNCHNALEMRPDVIARRIDAGADIRKQWKLNDLLGAIEINIPLDQAVTMARTQTQQGLFIVVGVTVIGLIGVVLLVFIDSARNRAMTTRLTYQAHHDSLTGLPNRSYFELEVARLIEDSDPLTVMLLDLDNFKQINDTLGHHAGDTVLRESSVRIAESIPEPGFVARLGGDEFAIILHHADREKVDNVAADVGKAIGQAFEIEHYTAALGVSIGIALYPSHGDELAELLRCADVAMYFAKNAGITSSIYDATHDHNHLSKLLLKNVLRDVVVAEKIAVYFQPKYCLRSGRMTGFEALARWFSDDYGNIPPDVFIPMTESLGLINDLTSSILEQSLKECYRWRENGFDLTVSVNISTVSLNDRSIVDMIENALSSTNLPSNALIIEVTESMMMSKPERAIDILRQISDLGVNVSIDDYGTGFCSLSYLTTLPITELKLDKSFIQKLKTHEKDALVVKATLDLAQSLDMKMVAEGVEDAETLDYLYDIGCDMVQGYFLCRPLSLKEMDRRLPYIYRFSPRAIGSIAKSDLNMSGLQDKAA